MSKFAEHEPDVLLQRLLLGEAIDAAGFPVLVADDAARYLEASSGACDLLGYTREEILALRVTDVVVERDAPQLYEEMVAVGHQEGAVTLRTRNGDHVTVAYEARTTLISGLRYYVSILRPVDPPARRRLRCARGVRGR
jgi:PAS domain S-box-containing protein